MIPLGVLQKKVDLAVDRMYKFAINRDFEVYDLEKGEMQYRNNELYHYTTIEGLKGILETGKIWATECNFLNDSTEMKHGRDMAEAFFSEKIRQLMTSVTEDDLRFLRTLNEIRSQALQQSFSNSFVSCFCVNGDALSQWRGYGARGGYSIRLNCISNRYPKQINQRYVLGKVQYDHSYQRAEIQKTYDKIVEVFADSLAHFPMEVIESTTERYESYKQLFARMNSMFSKMAFHAISSLFTRWKNDGFHEEHEWRIIHNEKLGNADLKYRTVNGILVPYVELPLFRDNNHEPSAFEVMGVICGPTPHPENAKLSVESFIKTLRNRSPRCLLGDNIIVTNSSIPYRSW